MYKLELFRNREAILTLCIALSIALYAGLLYIDLWKPRKETEDAPGQPKTGFLSVLEGIPWSLKVMIVVLILAMGSYVLYLFSHPINW